MNKRERKNMMMQGASISWRSRYYPTKAKLERQRARAQLKKQGIAPMELGVDIDVAFPKENKKAGYLVFMILAMASLLFLNNGPLFSHAGSIIIINDTQPSADPSPIQGINQTVNQTNVTKGGNTLIINATVINDTVVANALINATVITFQNVDGKNTIIVNKTNQITAGAILVSNYTLNTATAIDTTQFAKLLPALTNNGFNKVFYIQANMPYGTYYQNNTAVLPGKILRSILSDGNTLTVYNITTILGQPNTTISVSGLTLGIANTTAIVEPPIMPFGPHAGQWHLYGTLTGKLAKGNQVTWVPSIQLSNGTAIVAGSTTAGGISTSFDYWLPANMTANVILDQLGNKNYSATDPGGIVRPANILHWRNLTIANNQATATANGLQIKVDYNPSLDVPFLSCPSLQNIDFFYTLNGTLAKSWLQGNDLNSNAGFNGISCTSVDVAYWINYNLGIAATSSSTNQLTMGFAGVSNNLFTGTLGTTGEAPQLSNPYAVSDNANVVFGSNGGFYDNFLLGAMGSTSTTPDVQWTGWGACPGISCGAITIANGIFIQPNSAQNGGYKTSKTFNIAQKTLDFYGYYSPTRLISGFGTTQSFGYSVSGLSNPYLNIQAAFFAGPSYTIIGNDSNGNDAQGSNTKYNVFTIQVNSNTPTSYSDNAIVNYTVGNGPQPHGVSAFGYTSVPIAWNDFVTPGNIIVQYVLVRDTPPGGILPTVTFAPILGTFVTHANVIEYANITIHNNGASALVAGQVAEGNLNPLGNGFTNFLTNTLTNVMLFNGVNGGSAIPMWFNGGGIANTATNTPFYIKLPVGIAGNGNLVISIGFGPFSKVFLDGNITGGPAYAVGSNLDNGANVMWYSNFCSPTSVLNSAQWIGTNVQVANSLKGGCGVLLANAVTTVKLNSANQVAGSNVLVVYGGFQNTATLNKGAISYNSQNVGNPTSMVLQAGWGTTGISTGTANGITGRQLITTYGLASTGNQVIKFWSDGSTSFSENGPLDNSTMNHNAKATNALPSGNYPINITLNAGNAFAGANEYIAWIADYAAPPNNKMPTMTFTSLTAELGSVTITPNTVSKYDSSQLITAVASVAAGGSPPFTYTYTIANALGTTLNTYSFVSSSFSNTLAYTINGNTAYGGNSPISITVLVTDSAGATGSANTPALSISVATSAIPILYPNIPRKIEPGQVQTFVYQYGQYVAYSPGSIDGPNTNIANVFLGNGITQVRDGISCSAVQNAMIAMYAANGLIPLGIGFGGPGCGGNPSTLAAWNTSVRSIVATYPQVHHFEICNEPTNTQNGCNLQQGGSNAVTLMQTVTAASKIVRQLQPNATIACFAFGKGDIIANSVDYNTLQTMVADGFNITQNCDSIDLHFYTANGRILNFTKPGGNTIGFDENLSLGIWHALDPKIPIMITETSLVGNAATTGRAGYFNQSAFLYQSFTMFNNHSYIAGDYWYDGGGFQLFENTTNTLCAFCFHPAMYQFLYFNNETGVLPHIAAISIFNTITNTKYYTLTNNAVLKPYLATTWTPTSADVGNTFWANMTMTSSATTNVIKNSTHTGTFTVFASPTISSLICTPSSTYYSQPITCTVTWTGGVTAYSANILIGNTINGNVLANFNESYQQLTGTSNSLSFTAGSTTDWLNPQVTACITDNATVPNTVCSTNTITIAGIQNPNLVLTTPSPPYKIYDGLNSGIITVTAPAGLTANVYVNGTLLWAFTGTNTFTVGPGSPAFNIPFQLVVNSIATPAYFANSVSGVFWINVTQTRGGGGGGGGGGGYSIASPIANVIPSNTPQVAASSSPTFKLPGDDAVSKFLNWFYSLEIVQYTHYIALWLLLSTVLILLGILPNVIKIGNLKQQETMYRVGAGMIAFGVIVAAFYVIVLYSTGNTISAVQLIG